MKKLFIIGCVAILGLASCKKIHSCECTITYFEEDSSTEEKNEENYKEKLTKNDAEAKCNEDDLEKQIINGVERSTECELK